MGLEQRLQGRAGSGPRGTAQRQAGGPPGLTLRGKTCPLWALSQGGRVVGLRGPPGSLWEAKKTLCRLNVSGWGKSS